MHTPTRDLTPEQTALVITDGAFRTNHLIGSVAQSMQEGTDDDKNPGMWIRVYNGWLYTPIDIFNAVQRWGPCQMTSEVRKMIADTFKPDSVAV